MALSLAQRVGTAPGTVERSKTRATIASVFPRGPVYVKPLISRRGRVVVGAAPAPAAPPPAGERKAPKTGAAAPAADVPHWQQILAELEKKEGRKTMVIQTAPAVRVAISETMGLPPGAVTAGQLVTGLRMLGFDYVFDTLFAADLTILEEGTELLHRLEARAAAAKAAPGGAAAPFPETMYTSCCPGWVSMVEKSNPELIPYLSTCKSPQMMAGAVIKGFFAASVGVKPRDVVSCSVMPCVRKQGEADRPWFGTAAEMDSEDHADEDCATNIARDVDHVMTTVELGKIFAERGIQLNELPEGQYDNPMGLGSGGGLLFGTTGGVMEAALRTVYELVSGQPMGRIVFEEARGLEGIKEATVTIPVSDTSAFKALEPSPGAGVSLRIAVANGLGNAKKLIKGMADGTGPKYDFVEVMACPGGCIGGGGQPRSTDKAILQKRQAEMYSLDERSTVRRPHDNPAITQLYTKWLEKPNSHLAHERLHTHYVPGGVEGDK